MPFTDKQVQRILNVRGEAFMPKSRGSRAMRVTETYIRRRMYALEDHAVFNEYKLFRRAFRDIGKAANSIATRRGIRTLGNDAASTLWRRELLDVIEGRLSALSGEVAKAAYERSIEAYYAGYYGRLWVADMSTLPEVDINIPRPDERSVARKILQPMIQESFTSDEGIYQLLGQEWREQYASQLDTLVIKLRTSLTGSLVSGDGIPEAMRKVSGILGVDIDASKQNFNRVQALTRSFIMDASNTGAYQAFAANQDVISGYQWLAARDSRVCPTCRALDGRTWAFGDADMKFPPRDSHPNCRCTIIPIVRSDLALPPTSPVNPSQTLAEWLSAMGMLWLLNDFISGNEIDTSQLEDMEWDYENTGLD